VKKQPAAAASFGRPLSRFPLRGKAGAGGFPPRRKHAVRQQKALARSVAAGSPHKRAAAPLCIPRACSRILLVDRSGLLMEAATVREPVPNGLLRLLSPGVELERSPIVGFLVRIRGVQKAQLRGSQSVFWRYATR
jgi:hypothetical protein